MQGTRGGAELFLDGLIEERFLVIQVFETCERTPTLRLLVPARVGLVTGFDNLTTAPCGQKGKSSSQSR